MKIAAVETWPVATPLARPYAIAGHTTSEVELWMVRLEDERGEVGLGCASPEPTVTGEDLAACGESLSQRSVEWLVGRHMDGLGRLVAEVAHRHGATPAAAAALDTALHDLWARRVGRPLCDLLGRVHERLPTSITLGIRPREESVEEAEEAVGRGFRVLKVKVGDDLEQDLERLAAIRARVGTRIAIRVDANCGYRLAEVERFFTDTATLDLEFLEQPLARIADVELAALAPEWRARLAADESLLGPTDALRLAAGPFGVWNVKLMKCGGIRPALTIAAVAETAKLDLMWGCMDESVVGIAAALHAALASPATRYLDLDGSFDLARDPAVGGFELVDGELAPLRRPGLGVELAP
jgi:L-alanine-DL-glutamate epimerase-like enolase superfamily enzyme